MKFNFEWLEHLIIIRCSTNHTLKFSRNWICTALFDQVRRVGDITIYQLASSLFNFFKYESQIQEMYWVLTVSLPRDFIHIKENIRSQKYHLRNILNLIKFCSYFGRVTIILRFIKFLFKLLNEVFIMPNLKLFNFTFLKFSLKYDRLNFLYN